MTQSGAAAGYPECAVDETPTPPSGNTINYADAPGDDRSLEFQCSLLIGYRLRKAACVGCFREYVINTWHIGRGHRVCYQPGRI